MLHVLIPVTFKTWRHDDARTIYRNIQSLLSLLCLSLHSYNNNKKKPNQKTTEYHSTAYLLTFVCSPKFIFFTVHECLFVYREENPELRWRYLFVSHNIFWYFFSDCLMSKIQILPLPQNVWQLNSDVQVIYYLHNGTLW